MNKRIILLLLVLLASALCIRYLILRPALNYVSGYLSKSEQIKADLLVVEGWLPHYAMELARDEYLKGSYSYVVTTGVRYTPDYYKISDNGYLIFYTHNILAGQNAESLHSIEIKAFSDMGGANRAHFNFYINDSLTSEFTAERRKKSYSVNWFGRLKDIDSVMVQYDNDVYEPPLDRNLSVKEISFDNTITVPYLFNSEYDMLKLHGKLRFRNNLTTSAQAGRSELISLGIDSTIIVAVSSGKNSFNRTLASALAFRDWLTGFSSGREIRGINIITLGSHARRTWMTYNKVLDEKYNIGIISLPENEQQASGIRKSYKTLRETLGIIYYWFILIPY